MFVAGLVVILVAAGVFLAVDLVVPDSPGPRTSGVWASGPTPRLAAGRAADLPKPHKKWRAGG